MKRSKRSNDVSSRPERVFAGPRWAVRFGYAVGVVLAVATAPVRGDEPIVVATSILTVAEAVEVPAAQSGVLRSIHVREGARVEADAAIAEIDAREQRLHAAVVREDLALAQRDSESDVRVRLAIKENKVATAELRRATSVNATLPNTVSAKEVDRLQLAVERTELEIEHAHFERELLAAKCERIEADLRLAEHRIERLAIAAPLGGVVAQLYRREGEWVKEGEPIARLVRVDKLRVEGYLRVQDALRGLVDRPVEVATTLPTGEVLTATGRVVFVSPEAEPVESKVRFWAEVDNRELRLRPGLAARVTIGASRSAAERAAGVAATQPLITP